LVVLDEMLEYPTQYFSESLPTNGITVHENTSELIREAFLSDIPPMILDDGEPKGLLLPQMSRLSSAFLDEFPSWAE